MPSANYVLIEKITVGAAGASSVTFNSIPQTGYTDLVVKVSARLSSTDSPILVNFNGSNTGYTWRRIYGNGSAASSLSGSDGYFLHGDTSSMTASTFSSSELYIPNYTSSNYKSVSTDTALETNATAGELFMLASLWSNTAAITSITLTALTGSLVANSTFYLYGVAKLGTTPAIVPYATGGDTIMTDGTYWYHAFKSSGTFTPQKGLSCDVLVVAGGGGGGISNGGGGGAGGLVLSSAQSFVTSTNYTVTIGSGGAGAPSGTPAVGSAGTNSNVTGGALSLTAAIGGGFGGFSGSNGGSGGSGGGGGNGRTSGAGTSGQGNTGGNGGASAASYYPGGGGGGAGAAGAAGNAAIGGGDGGAGVNTYSSWLSTTGTGVSGFIAGGGGGSTDPGGYFGRGGSGGGGNAGTNGSSGNGIDAIANTGSGGGGATTNNSGIKGGAGGSGLVIVRYAV